MIYLPFMVNVVVKYTTPMDPMGMESSHPSLKTVIPAQVHGFWKPREG